VRNPLLPTTTTVSSSLNPSALGASVTFTAQVTPTGGPGTPTGALIFKDGTTPLGAAILLGGAATFTTNALAIGAHSITAVFAGTLDFYGSTSPALAQTVTGDAGLPADIGVSVAHSPNTPVIAIGSKLAITVTVTNNDDTNPARVALTLSTIAGRLEIDSVSTPGGETSCNPPGGNAIQCTIPNLEARSSAVFTVNVRPLLSDLRTLTVIASEASNTTDPVPGNNTATDTIQVRFKAFRQ
jgi:Bacterial Ig-like domain (group 3)/Domain of unknown function DUF11